MSFAFLRTAAQDDKRSAVVAFAVAMTLLFIAAGAQAENSATPPKLPGKVTITQNLNAQIPMGEMFRDETGKIVRLGDYFRSGKPVLLNFVYYTCPMLCSMVLEGTTNSLTELKFNVGKEFEVVTISIDPRDLPEQAAEKKALYVKRYGRPGANAGWHFLTGHESAIKRVTGAAGFQYAYDPSTRQFAHGALLLALTPDGRVSRYLYGFEYKARDIRLALVEASKGKIGTATDQVLLLCFHYDPATGKYSATAMNAVRAGGVATVFGLGGFIFLMLRAERRQLAARTQNDTQ